MTIRRLSTAALVAAGLAVLGAATATAAEAPNAPAAPTASDLSAAHSAAAAPQTLTTVGRFFAAGGQKPHGTAQDQAAAAAATPRLDSATVPVYYLSRAFVADTSADAPAVPVADLAFLATDVVSSTGAHASVWTARTASGWTVANIASGSDETAFAAKVTPGATAFKEPQIGAWYELRDGRVLPLNANAQTTVGRGGVSIGQYHSIVRARYADKLPGSVYDRKGVAGGFNPHTAAVAQPAHAQSVNLVAPATAAIAGLITVAAGFGVYRRVRAV